MVKSYKVAEHIFNLDMRDGEALWGLLKQYSPFETELSDKPVFTLNLVDSLGLPQCAEDGTRNIPGAVSIYKNPREKGEPTIDLYKLEDGRWYFEMSPVNTYPVCVWLVTSPDFKSASVELGHGRDRLFGLNNSMMLLYAFNTSTKGVLEMHASVIKYQGRGYLFLGRSGAGKSTHSRQWLAAFEGAQLLNDDNPIIRLDENGKAIVYGSPWSGKTPCYKNDKCPIAALVRIIQHPENIAEKIGLFESYAMVYSSCSGLKSDLEMSDGIHDTLEKVVTSVPCFTIKCLPNEDAARVCYKEICANE